MLEFERGRLFVRQWKRAPVSVRERAATRLQLLYDDEFHPMLHNHKLTGEYAGYRSINVTGDWRIVYRMTDPNTIYLYAIGTHSELYGA